MSVLGVDYASPGVPCLDVIKAHGYKFAFKYATNVPGGLDKMWHADELAHARAIGLGIGMLFESVSERVLDGHSAGQYDARLVLTTWEGQPNVPPRFSCHFTVDFSPEPSQLTSVIAYFQGVTSVMAGSRVGVYGSFDVVETVLRETTVRYGYQTAAWSQHKVSSLACLYQTGVGQNFGSFSADEDRALLPDYGTWNYAVTPTPTPTPPPAPTPKPKGHNMFLVHADDTGINYMVKEDGMHAISGAEAASLTLVGVPSNHVKSLPDADLANVNKVLHSIY